MSDKFNNKDAEYLFTYARIATIYIILLFIGACVCLYLTKVKPEYTILLYVVGFGCLLVIFHIILRYIWLREKIKKLQLRQIKNIVPYYCPDYWSKTVKPKGNSTCRNEFVVQNNIENGEVNTYRFGTATTPTEITLQELAKMKNSDKCDKIQKYRTPWVDMEMRCGARYQ
jgi:hypothetical protein